MYGILEININTYGLYIIFIIFFWEFVIKVSSDFRFISYTSRPQISHIKKPC
jgi:hypothetical protein